MIFDDFKNIDLYGIAPEVKEFILNIDPNISTGRHIISGKAFINIDEYKTRGDSEIKLEAHRKYIDIQFLIQGEEKVYITDRKNLKVNIEYNDDKDIEFFETPNRKLNTIYLEKNKFVVLYPDDVHSPCMNFENESKPVKKAIVKIKI